MIKEQGWYENDQKLGPQKDDFEYPNFKVTDIVIGAGERSKKQFFFSMSEKSFKKHY